MEALDVPGGGRRINELLAFFKIEEEEREAQRKKDELQRQIESSVRQPRRR